MFLFLCKFFHVVPIHYKMQISCHILSNLMVESHLKSFENWQKGPWRGKWLLLLLPKNCFGLGESHKTLTQSLKFAGFSLKIAWFFPKKISLAASFSYCQVLLHKKFGRRIFFSCCQVSLIQSSLTARFDCTVIFKTSSHSRISFHSAMSCSDIKTNMLLFLFYSRTIQ